MSVCNISVFSMTVCLSVCLSVTSVNFLSNRMKEVQENVFLHFTVKLFLESQEVELSRFVQELSDLDLADERCSLMEDQLEFFTETIVEYTSWICELGGGGEVAILCTL